MPSPPVLKDLQLKNFRGFEQLGLKQLNRVNLIVGDNNTGKTSILEALFLLLADGRQLTDLASSFRATELEGKRKLIDNVADSLERFWLWLFFKHDVGQGFRIEGTAGPGIKMAVEYVARNKRASTPHAHLERVSGDKKEEILDLGELDTLRFPGVGHPGLRMSVLSVRPSNPVDDATRFNLVANRPGGEEAAERFMMNVEGRLRKLRYRKLRSDSDAVVYAELDGLPEFIPTTQLGQAFTRMLHIYCEIEIEKSGVFLVDEIENGIYYANLLPFWAAVMSLNDKQNAQIFATTHSFECLRAAHQAACERADKPGGSYDLNIIRLDRVEWGVKATEFGREAMEMAVDRGWEMR